MCWWDLVVVACWRRAGADSCDPARNHYAPPALSSPKTAQLCPFWALCGGTPCVPDPAARFRFRSVPVPASAILLGAIGLVKLIGSGETMKKLGTILGVAMALSFLPYAESG